MSGASPIFRTAAPTVLAPLVPRQRIQVIDVLRGWAMFGVLLVDIGALWQPDLWTATEQGVYHFFELFAEEKFYTLLSFLFGLGFSLQLIRAEGRGPGFIAAYGRRLFVLLLIGVFQTVFLLWDGPILIEYAAMGFLLLLLRGLPSRTLLPLALILMLVPWAHTAGVDYIHARRLANPQTQPGVLRADSAASADWVALRQEAKKTVGEPSYARRVSLQARQFYLGHIKHPSGFWWNGMYVLGLFLVGLYVGRRGFLLDIPAHLPLVRRVLIWGLALGLVANAIRYFIPPFNLAYATSHGVKRLVAVFGDPALAFAYAAAIVLLAQRPVWQRRLAPLAAAGRMSLTNYLLMAVLLGILVPTFGFGVYKRIGPILSPFLAVAIYAALMWLSTWWLKRFRFGPVEWLWRSATYAKWQPMRIANGPLTARVAGAQ
jgi:uncharacterized protein